VTISADDRRTGSQILATAGDRYSVVLTRDRADIRAAQRPRHDVFTGEFGARLTTTLPGLDVDDFDPWCDHLVVRDHETWTIVGTYRLLPPAGASAAGRLYSDGEFDLAALDPIRPDLVEAGRTCVRPDHRNGVVVGLLWTGIARYMPASGHTWPAGCCSVPLNDGGVAARHAWNVVKNQNMSPDNHRVRPHRPWAPPTAPAGDHRPRLPALLRSYLRLGARVCGPPAHDPEFDVADFFVLLSLDRVEPRYARRLLSTPA
jgi:putative hemolysin